MATRMRNSLGGPSQWHAIEAELAITEHQAPAWQRFMADYNSAASALAASDDDVARTWADRPPSLPCALDIAVHSLSLRLAKAQMLSTSLEAFHAALTPRQQKRADRLLSSLCAEIAPPHLAMPVTPRGSAHACARSAVHGQAQPPLAA